VLRSADKTRKVLIKLARKKDGLHLLHELKFKKSGVDPLDEKRPLNLIEQLNQMWTYLATFQAAADLLRRFPASTPLIMRLGTEKGPDICSQDDSIVAEVFAATDPRSNQKLSKDVAKVAGQNCEKKFVYYYSPKAHSSKDEKAGVTVIRLSKL